MLTLNKWQCSNVYVTQQYSWTTCPHTLFVYAGSAYPQLMLQAMKVKQDILLLTTNDIVLNSEEFQLNKTINLV